MTPLNTIIEEEVESVLREFEDCPASKHINAILTLDHIRNGKKDWEGETTRDVLIRLLATAMQRAYEAGEREADAKWEREVEGMRKESLWVELDSKTGEQIAKEYDPLSFNDGCDQSFGFNLALDTLLSKITHKTPTS